MTDLIVEAQEVSFRRAGRQILDTVSLSVERGSSVALMGPSGSGKTALLTLIAGLERPDGGRVVVRAPPTAISTVLQGYGLVGLLTVEENVALPLLTAGRPAMSPDRVDARVREALSEIGLITVAGSLVETLSGGQQQRVAIARTLVSEPSLVLADEPSAALDADTRAQVLAALLRLQHSGSTLIVATHDPSVATLLDQTVLIEEGVIALGS